jgi:NAD(P)-dependent dehydrogenase (short-subunit alcohol dehydrogenase family)
MPFFSSNPFKKLSEDSLKDLCKNKNVLIVGGTFYLLRGHFSHYISLIGTAGIGKALAISLLKHGAQVTIVGRRDPDASLAQAKFVRKDLSLLKNAQSLADDVDASLLDIIVFTNGIICSPERKETSEGIEIDLGVSYLSRYFTLLKYLPSIDSHS